MGLAERRAVKEFQDHMFPELKNALERAAGFPVPVEVEWDGLARDEMSHLYAECFPKVYFRPLIDALKTIAADQMGKDALQSGLKKILIRNSAQHYSPSSAITFQNGVLTVDHDPVTNADDIRDRTEYTVKILEKNL
jgi:hypothetical protein